MGGVLINLVSPTPLLAQSVCQSNSQGNHLDERIVRCGASLDPGSLSSAEKAQDWLALAGLHRLAGDTRRAQQLLEQLGQQHQNSGSTLRYDIAFAQGVTGYFARDFTGSFIAFKQAYGLAQASDSPAKLASVYNGLANLSQVRSDYDSMVRLLEMASELYRQLGDRQGLAKVYNNLGNAYRFTHRHNLALSTYRRALYLHNELGLPLKAAHTQVNMARSLIQLDQLEKGAQLLELSLAYFTSAGALQRQMEIQGLLAQIAMEQGKYNQAGKYLANNQNLKVQSDTHVFDPGSEMIQARYYLYLNQNQQAEQLIKQGIQFTQEQGNQYYLKGFVKLLAEFYAGTHEQGLVNQYLKQHSQLLDEELKHQQRNFGQLSDIFYAHAMDEQNLSQPMETAQLVALINTQQTPWSWLILLLGAGGWYWHQRGSDKQTCIGSTKTPVSHVHSEQMNESMSQQAVCLPLASQGTGETPESGRKKLVELMLLAIQLWEQETQTDRLELADRSKIWNVSQDDGRLRVRAMDRYMSMEKLPHQPRWRNVVRTCYFVLNHCPSSSPLQLELSQCLSHFLEWEKQKATSV